MLAAHISSTVYEFTMNSHIDPAALQTRADKRNDSLWVAIPKILMTTAIPPAASANSYSQGHMVGEETGDLTTQSRLQFVWEATAKGQLADEAIRAASARRRPGTAYCR
jgi:hypothetical protein